MTFRMRPSSKRSTDTEHSLVQYSNNKTLHQAFISNEGMTLKQIANKLDILESNMNNLSELARKDKEISNAGYIEVQRRLDTLQYKSFSNEKDIKQIYDVNKSSFSPLAPIVRKEDSSNALGGGLSKNEVMILKQTLLQQRESQKQQLKHMSSLMEQMSMKQLRLQQELRQTLNQTKQDTHSRLSDQTDEMRKYDHIKTRKLDQQYQMIKQNMAAVERRIYEQLQSKMRKETILKDYINERVGEVREEISQEQKQIISTQVKLTRQTKQSLQSLFSMISQIKASFSDQLTETQTLSVNNIKRVAMNLDILSEKFDERIKSTEEEVRDNSHQMNEFRQWVVGKLDENRQIVMGLEEDAIERIERKRQGKGDADQGSVDSQKMNQKFNLLQQDMTQWKSMTEQKNLSIFKQISQTLKHMKVDFKKQNDQFSSELISLTQSLKSVKKSLPLQMKKISQSIVTIFNDQFDVLAEQLDLITQMIKVSKAEVERGSLQAVKKFKTEAIQQVKGMLASLRKDIILANQKAVMKSEQNQTKTLKKQTAYVQSLLNQKIQSIESNQQSIQSNSKKLNLNTNAQLETFTLSMKQFNENYKNNLQEQRKQDLRKRIQLEQNMRKNASNLMDVSYKKSQFLVEGMKNVIEMNFMKDKLSTKQDIQALRDQIGRNTQEQKNYLHETMKAMKEKLVKQRQASENALEEGLNQSMISLKKALDIEIGNQKIQLQQKIQEGQASIEEKISNNAEQIQMLSNGLVQMAKKQKKERQSAKKEQQQAITAMIQELQGRIDEIQAHAAGEANNQKQSQKKQLKDLQNRLSQMQAKVQGQQTQAEIDQIKQTIEALEQKMKNQIKQNQNQKSKKKDQQGQKKNMEDQTKRMKLMEEQLKKQVENQMAELGERQEDQLKELEQSVASLRQAVWKMEAMNFSEQAKNKALFDRINEDLNKVGLNLTVIAKQLEIQSKMQK